MAVRKIAKSNDFCASLADNILQKIDPIYRLNKQYEGSGFVESTEIMVDAAIGSAASGSAAPRTWSDSSGSFKVEANYLGVSEDKVFLRKMDGQEVSGPCPD